MTTTELTLQVDDLLHADHFDEEVRQPLIDLGPEALELLQTYATGSHPSGDPDIQGRAILTLGDTEDPTTALPALSRAIASPDPDTRIRAMGELDDHRRKNQFAKLITAGWEAVQRGIDHPRIRRLLAQGLIEQGQLDDAEAVLNDAVEDIGDRLARIQTSDRDAPARLALRRERTEVLGLLGRVLKQTHVNVRPTPERPHTEDARKACVAYLICYTDAPHENLWHGINYVAIRMHQERRHPWVEGTRTDNAAVAVAEQLLQTLDVLADGAQLGNWDLATKAEAHLSLGEYDEAAATFAEYVNHPEVQPFNLSSTARQMREIWELDQIRALLCYRNSGDSARP